MTRASVRTETEEQMCGSETASGLTAGGRPEVSLRRVSVKEKDNKYPREGTETAQPSL